MSMVIDDSVS